MSVLTTINKSPDASRWIIRCSKHDGSMPISMPGFNFSGNQFGDGQHLVVCPNGVLTVIRAGNSSTQSQGGVTSFDDQGKVGYMAIGGVDYSLNWSAAYAQYMLQLTTPVKDPMKTAVFCTAGTLRKVPEFSITIRCMKCGTKHLRGIYTWKPCKNCGWHIFDKIPKKYMVSISRVK